MIQVSLIFLFFSNASLAYQPVVPGPIPFHEVVKIVLGRVQGRLLAANEDLPDSLEFTLGTNMVQELRILSPQGNIIIVRVDDTTGRILDIRGRGLTAAHTLPDQKNRKHN